MKTITEKQFLNWVSANGMGLDERYPDSAVLTFKPDTNLNRFWEFPAEPERRPYFLSVMLQLMGEWDSCFVWRHLGSWPSKANPNNPNDIIEFQILSGVGLPMGTADIVEFEKPEIDRLMTLLFFTTVFSWSIGEDLYVVPEHAQYIMQTDHHGVIHVSFRDAEGLQKFITRMHEEKFPLPDDVPDTTFKVPDWMKHE